MEVSDRIEKQDPTTPLLRRLEFEKAAVLGTTDWRTKLDPLLQTDLRKYRTYKVDTVTVRALFMVHSSVYCALFVCCRI